MGEKWQYPRITDTSTLNGNLTEGEGKDPLIEVSASSLIHSETAFSPHYFAGDEQILDHNIRYILLTPDDASDADVEQHSPSLSRSRKVYRFFESGFPRLFDDVREIQRCMRERDGKDQIEKYRPITAETVNTSGDTHHPWTEIIPGEAGSSAPRAVIVALHWLQSGGAETWAVRTIELVKEAGLLPIVITDRDSHQPWISRPELDGCLILPLTFPMQERIGDEPLLRALFEQFSIPGVLVHHNQWMYDRLWWIKKYFPQTQVVDSLHIVEYKYQGGYPAQAVSRDQWIDLHHVISPQLEDWLENIHGIEAKKVVDAPLLHLTTEESSTREFKDRKDLGKLTIAFIGRVARQKRPEAFLLLVEALNKKYPGEFKAIMHGSGDMDPEADAIVKELGLDQESLERRSMDVPVSVTYDDADVLVISSVDEGITLTTLEALNAGIPVISSDVGSQYTLIPDRALMRRRTRDFIKDGVQALHHLKESDSIRHSLWDEEVQKLQEFSKLEPADNLFKRIIKGWSE
jgi:glycosyltransferase involved in cell wall biosynthesis